MLMGIGDIKPYSLTHSLTHSLSVLLYWIFLETRYYVINIGSNSGDISDPDPESRNL